MAASAGNGGLAPTLRLLTAAQWLYFVIGGQHAGQNKKSSAVAELFLIELAPWRSA
ncbi:hypothetical protein [Cupriavidus alkaliphilus]|uniref:hypothetical protein n=1 Tax=Cupriavidus alkaliphilus TaxID=942866 RepID=UPI00339DA1E0